MSQDVRQSGVLGQYRTYDPPPAGFDPHTATDRDLLRHGLPRRPDPATEPELVREWKRVFADPLTYVKAELAIAPVIGEPNPLTQREAGRWVGGAVRQGSPFKWVFAEWVIPKVWTDKSVWDPSFSLGFWVGIDGVTIGNDQVLQAGVAVTATTNWFGWPPWPHVEVKWWAWSEWWTAKWEDDAVQIENFPVKPGDTVSFIVCAPDPDSDTGSIFARNATTGVATTLGRKAPEGHTLTGDSAEWIVEPKGKIARFDPVTFKECLAGKPTFGLAEFSSVFEMNLTDVTGKELIHTELEAPRSVTVTWKASS